VPPAPLTGVKEVAAWFTVKLVEATVCVALTALSTVTLKVAVAVALLASVTVTVYVVVALTPEGVPVIIPVLDAKMRPVGSVGATL